jgi:hypothetical protein
MGKDKVCPVVTPAYAPELSRRTNWTTPVGVTSTLANAAEEEEPSRNMTPARASVSGAEKEFTLVASSTSPDAA